MARIVLWLLGSIMALGVSGCSLKYTVDEPPAAGVRYQQVKVQPLTLRMVDQRSDVHFMVGISGLERVSLSLTNLDDPVAWLGQALVRELNGRGVPVRLAVGGSAAPADITFTVKRFQLINHRASGFSAWESYTLLLGQVSMGEKSCLIPSFFFNSKLPVWSMDEVQKPCISDPLAITVKEVASKVNQCLFQYAAGPDELQRLVSAAQSTVKPDSPTACFPLIDLGGSNNPVAMPVLQQFANAGDSFVHNCAVSAIGTLGARDQFAFLDERFEHFAANDRVMPLKAIGDIGDKQALEFLRKVQVSPLYTEEHGVRYCTDLYLSR